jgi:ABC-type phosphate transport system permease subunit
MKKAVVDEAGKTIGREGIKLAAKTAYNGAKSFLTSSAIPAIETAAAEAAPVAVEAAPLLLAAGVKRKTTARHELIKKIMKKKHMTLPQASKYIKENKLKY